MPRDWQTELEQTIPLVRAMGVVTMALDDGRVRLDAPLAPNVNDKGTGFGGSVATLATLAGWVETQRQLDQAGVAGPVDIVIQRGQTRYLQPIRSAFSAVVSTPDGGEVDRFVRMLARRGMARLTMEVAIFSAGETCAQFDAEYVASRQV
jgi:thioesterase domain-containing protein